MNAPRHINTGSAARDGAVTMQPLTQLVKIAALLANPVRAFHPDHVGMTTGGLEQAQLDGLCNIDEVRKRLNTAVADRIGTATLDFHLPVIGDVCNLVVAPDAAIEDFLRQVTAVRLQHAIRNCVLKADRERARALLGDAAYNTALREAPYFYTDLAAKTERAFFAGAPTPPTLSVGAKMTHRYVATLDRGLAQIFTWRLPKAFITDDVPLNAAQSQSFARLLASKGPQTTIGVG